MAEMMNRLNRRANEEKSEEEIAEEERMKMFLKAPLPAEGEGVGLTMAEKEAEAEDVYNINQGTETPTPEPKAPTREAPREAAPVPKISGVIQAVDRIPAKDPFKPWFKGEMDKIKKDYDKKEEKVEMNKAIEIMVHALTKWGAAKQGVSGLKFDKTDFNAQLARLDKKRGEARSDIKGELASKLSGRAAELAAQKAIPKGEQELRKEYNGLEEVKEFKKLNSALGRVLASKDDAAGDLSMLFSYMKILDPLSVVRESEFREAAKAGSLPERLKAKIGSWTVGTRLTGTQRKRFKDQAKLIVKRNHDKNVAKTSAKFSAMAEQQGLDPSNVVTPIGLEDVAETKKHNGKEYRKVEGGWELIK